MWTLPVESTFAVLLCSAPVSCSVLQAVVCCMWTLPIESTFAVCVVLLVSPSLCCRLWCAACGVTVKAGQRGASECRGCHRWFHGRCFSQVGPLQWYLLQCSFLRSRDSLIEQWYQSAVQSQFCRASCRASCCTGSACWRDTCGRAL